MSAILPILDLMDGYAMKNEKVERVEWHDSEVSAIIFPNGELRAVHSPHSGVKHWVLSVNECMMAVFS
jgi:hypothetical protein